MASTRRAGIRSRRLVAGLALATALLAALANPSVAQAADAIEGRWEFVTPTGGPFPGGPIYDFVATAPGAYTNKVIRNWGLGCGAVDGELKLSRVDAAGLLYRGTSTVLVPPLCRATREDPVELTIRADGLALISYPNGTVQYFQRRPFRIGELKLTFGALVERRKTELRPLVAKLGREKEAAEAAVRRSSERATNALAQRKELETKAVEVARALGALDGFVRGFEAVQLQSWPGRAQDLVPPRNHLVTQIVRLEGDAARAAAEGQGVSALRARVANLRRQLSEIDRSIVAVLGPAFRQTAAAPYLRDRAVDEYEGWIARMRRLEEQVFDLRLRRIELEQEWRTATDALERDLGRRDRVDAKLTPLVLQLQALEFGIREVAVTAGGDLVFRAARDDKLARRLAELEKELAAWSQTRADLKKARDDARLEFTFAAGEAAKAGERVATVQNRVRWGRYVLDVGFHTLDVLGAVRSGGAAGGGSEGLKKIGEIVFFNYIVPSKSLQKKSELVRTIAEALKDPDSSGIRPGSVEDEINARYGAELKDSLSVPLLQNVAAERGLKLTVSKVAKDYLNTLIVKKIFDVTGYKVAEKELLKLRKPPPVRRNAVRRAEQLARIKDAQAGLDARLDRLKGKGHSLAQVKKLGGGFTIGLKDVIQGAVKDLAKAVLKRPLEAAENAAWQTFYRWDIYSRSLYAQIQHLNLMYYDAVDGYREAETEQAGLLQRYSQATGLKTTVDKEFPATSALRITLQVTLATGGRADRDLAVLVGRKQAVRQPGQFVYDVVASEAQVGTDPRLSIEIR